MRVECRKVLGALGALLLLSLLHRALSFQEPSTWIDPISYWKIAREIAEGLPFRPVFHIASRLALILPATLARLALPDSSLGYFGTAWFFAIGQVLLIYLGGRWSVGHWAGVFAALLFLALPFEDASAASLSADSAATFYLLLAFVVVLRARDRLHFYFVAGFAFWLAYLSKISMALLLPCFIYVIWRGQPRARGKVLGAFLGAFFLGLALEPLLHLALGGRPSNSLLMTLASYGRTGRLKVLSLGDYLLRFSELGALWLIVLGVALAATVWILRRPTQVTSGLKPWLALPWLFCAALLYGLKSVNPLVPAALVQGRQLLPILPFLCLLIAAAATSLLAARRPPLRQGVCGLLGLVLLLFCLFPGGRAPEGFAAWSRYRGHERKLLEAHEARARIFSPRLPEPSRERWGAMQQAAWLGLSSVTPMPQAGFNQQSILLSQLPGLRASWCLRVLAVHERLQLEDSRQKPEIRCP